MDAISRRRFSKSLLGAGAMPLINQEVRTPEKTAGARRPSLTDVEGLLVGNFTLTSRPTGCTVITSKTAFTAGVDVRGGAPGTRETDLLRAENLVQQVNAIVLSGGSAFGLDTATGAMKYLEEKGIGFDVQVVKVPIVCAAILFDLRLGDPRIRPDASAGFEAARAAGPEPVPEGNTGAGAGATVGKMLGMEWAMKGGLGSWAVARPDGLIVGALAAVNCVGDVVDPSTGRILAGARTRDGKGFAGISSRLQAGGPPGSLSRQNTVLGVVGTNADLNKAQCSKVAQMAQDALARCIRPAHTPWDGDTVFAVATGRWKPETGSADAGLVGALAADALSSAILRGVREAQSWGPFPAVRDYPAGGK